MTDTTRYGPCPTRLDNQPTPSARPWSYAHAASIEGAHWNVYAGEGIDGWLVGMTTTEADAALIVEAVNALAQPAAPAEGLNVERRRDPGVDWDAVERLVDDAIRREEITAARGAEILGLRLVTWRQRALEMRAALEANHE